MGEAQFGSQLCAIICAVTYAGIGVLSYKIRRIGPNTLAGFRSKYTMADLAVWRDINERSGRALSKYGFICTIVFLAVFLYPTPWLLLTTVIVSLGPLIWICVYYQKESKRQFEERHPGESPKYGQAMAEARAEASARDVTSESGGTPSSD